MAMSFNHIDWLQYLIRSYEIEHAWLEDADPDATREMLSWCHALYAELKQAHPVCLMCSHELQDGPDLFCSFCRAWPYRPAGTVADDIPY